VRLRICIYAAQMAALRSNNAQVLCCNAEHVVIRRRRAKRRLAGDENRLFFHPAASEQTFIDYRPPDGRRKRKKADIWASDRSDSLTSRTLRAREAPKLYIQTRNTADAKILPLT
jgi:hypothetical protein